MDTRMATPAPLDCVDINQRPEWVNNRQVFGYWEAGTMIGKVHKGAIVRLDECIAKLRLPYPVNSKHKDQVCAAISVLLKASQAAVNAIAIRGKSLRGMAGESLHRL